MVCLEYIFAKCSVGIFECAALIEDGFPNVLPHEKRRVSARRILIAGIIAPQLEAPPPSRAFQIFSAFGFNDPYHAKLRTITSAR